MPLGRTLARINKRIANPIMRRFGFLPAMAIVVHRGRSSGREYRTPVLAFPTDQGLVIALVYGLEVDWLKNVLAAGSCTVIRRGRPIEVGNPRVVGWAAGSKPMPIAVRLALLGVQARDFLLLDSVSADT